MFEDLPELVVGGRIYSGWTSIRVTRGIEQASAVFDLQVTERWAGAGLRGRMAEQRIRRGDPCEVRLGGELLITGYVNVYAPSYGPAAHGVRIAGRSKTSDLVDCSVVLPGGQFRSYDLAAIVRAVAQPFGVNVVIEADTGGPVPDVQIQQGESAFDLIERVCRLRELLVYDRPDGSLVIARAGARSSQGALEEAGNIVSASGTFDDSQRFSDYVVKGQQSGWDAGDGEGAAQVIGRVRDPGVTRYRPKLTVAESQVSDGAAQARADWECRRRAGRSVQAAVTVQGWRQSAGGRLWTVNELVPVRSPWLDLDRPLLLSEVQFSLNDRSGHLTDLTLSPPEAFSPEPVKARGAGDGSSWADVRSIRG